MKNDTPQDVKTVDTRSWINAIGGVAASATLSLTIKIFVKAIFSAWRRDLKHESEHATLVWLHYSIIAILTKTTGAWLFERYSKPRLPIVGDALIDAITITPLADWPWAGSILAVLDAFSTSLIWGTPRNWPNLANFGANDMSFSGSVVFTLWWLLTGACSLHLRLIVRLLIFSGVAALTLCGMSEKAKSRRNWWQWLTSFGALHIIELYLWDCRLLQSRPELFSVYQPITPRELLRSQSDVLTLARGVLDTAPGGLALYTGMHPMTSLTSQSCGHDASLSTTARELSNASFSDNITPRWVGTLNQLALLPSCLPHESPICESSLTSASPISTCESTIRETSLEGCERESIQIAAVVDVGHDAIPMSPREQQRIVNIRNSLVADAAQTPLTPACVRYNQESEVASADQSSVIATPHHGSDTLTPISKFMSFPPKSTLDEILNIQTFIPIIHRDCYERAWKWLVWGILKRNYTKIRIKNDPFILRAIIHYTTRLIVIAYGTDSFAVLDRKAQPTSLQKISREVAFALLSENCQRVFHLNNRSGNLSASYKTHKDPWLIIVTPVIPKHFEDFTNCPLIWLEPNEAKSSFVFTPTTAVTTFDMQINLPSMTLEEFAAFLRFCPQRSSFCELAALFEEFGTSQKAYAAELVGIQWRDNWNTFNDLYHKGGANRQNSHQIFLRNNLFSISLINEALYLIGSSIIPHRLLGWTLETENLHSLLCDGYPSSFIAQSMYTTFVNRALMSKISLSTEVAASPLIRSAHLRALILHGKAQFIVADMDSLTSNSSYSSQRANIAAELDIMRPSGVGVHLRPSMIFRSVDLYNGNCTAFADSILHAGPASFLVQHSKNGGLSLCRIDYITGPKSTSRFDLQNASESPSSISSIMNTKPPTKSVSENEPETITESNPRSYTMPCEESLTGVGIVLKNQTLSRIESVQNSSEGFDSSRGPCYSNNWFGAECSPHSFSLPDPRLHKITVVQTSNSASSGFLSRGELPGLDATDASPFPLDSGRNELQLNSTIYEESESVLESKLAVGSSSNKDEERIHAKVDIFHLQFWPYWFVDRHERSSLRKLLKKNIVCAESTIRDFNCLMQSKPLRRDELRALHHVDGPNSVTNKILFSGFLRGLSVPRIGSGLTEIEIILTDVKLSEIATKICLPTNSLHSELVGLTF